LRVLERDGYRCLLLLPGCTGDATEVDHLVPWTPGTPSLDSQLVSACRSCNSRAGSPESRNLEQDPPAWL
jgi:5-methylcytosine-specific restriction endonuclease McrA